MDKEEALILQKMQEREKIEGIVLFIKIPIIVLLIFLWLDYNSDLHGTGNMIVMLIIMVVILMLKMPGVTNAPSEDTKAIEAHAQFEALSGLLNGGGI